MSDEPYSPGGEHCPKCGERHDGRCSDKHQKFVAWFASRLEGTYDSRCQSDNDIRRAYEARQPEIDALRNFARLLWAYYDNGAWNGTRVYDEAVAEARKLGIVEASDAS